MSIDVLLRPLRRLDSWFFAPAPALRLARWRAVVGTFALAYLLIRLPVFAVLLIGAATTGPSACCRGRGSRSTRRRSTR